MIYGLPPLRLGDTWRGAIAVVLICVTAPIIDALVWYMNLLLDIQERH